MEKVCKDEERLKGKRLKRKAALEFPFFPPTPGGGETSDTLLCIILT